MCIPGVRHGRGGGCGGVGFCLLGDGKRVGSWVWMGHLGSWWMILDEKIG